MVATNLSYGGTVSSGLTNKPSWKWAFSSNHSREFRVLLVIVNSRGPINVEVGVGRYSLSLDKTKRFLSSTIIRHRKPIFSRFDSGVQSYNIEESSGIEEEILPENSSPLNEFYGTVSSGIGKTNGKLTEDPANTSQSKEVIRELIMLSLPALAGQAIEPLVQLMETAYIGRLGSVELASAGVSISLFNIISRVFNIPLLSVATSFVAEDVSRNASRSSAADEERGAHEKSLIVAAERLQLSSVSTALLLAVGIGIFEAMALSLGSGQLLGLMGISRASSMRAPAQRFLIFRALGAPAFVVILALQGIFRGFKDTKTPVYCLGGFLIGRTLAVLLTLTLGTSMAARQGPIAMAAHQICIQVWLAVSLLTDALGTSAQALVASYISKDDYRTVKDVTRFVLKIGFVAGVSLAVILGFSFSSLAPLFTEDVEVLRIVRTGILFVSASQPINALAFIFDGLHYGVSDFPYAARSMMLVGAISSSFLLCAPTVFGLPGVWSGLTLFMGLRVMAGIIRLMSEDGPWWFLHGDVNKAKIAG